MASSVIQRTGLSESPLSRAFSLPHSTMFLTASRWQTLAPAAAQASVAPPVYANRLSTFISRPAPVMSFLQSSQFTACSGKRPVCLNPVGFTRNVRSPYFMFQLSGSFFRYSQLPPPLDERLYFACTLSHSGAGEGFFHITCGSGRLSTTSPHFSSLSPSEVSISL